MYREEEKDLLGQRLRALPEELRVSAPSHLWDNLAAELDDLALDEQLKDKLSGQKTKAPSGLWSAISADLVLDDDSLMDQKIREAYAQKESPKAPAELWSAIDQQLELEQVWTKLQRPLDQLAFRYRFRVWSRRLSWAALLLLFCKACGPEISENFWPENKAPLVQKTTYQAEAGGSSQKKEEGKSLLGAGKSQQHKNASGLKEKEAGRAKKNGPKMKATAEQLPPTNSLLPAAQGEGEEAPDKKANILANTQKESAVIDGQLKRAPLNGGVDNLKVTSSALASEEELASPLYLSALLPEAIVLEEELPEEVGPEAPITLKRPERKHYIGLRSSLEQQLLTNDFQQKKVEYQHLTLLLAADHLENGHSLTTPSFNWALDYRYALSREQQLTASFWWSKNLVKTYDYSYKGLLGKQDIHLNYMSLELGLEQSLYRLWGDKLQAFVELGGYAGKMVQFESSRSIQSSGNFLFDYNQWEWGVALRLGQRHKFKNNWELQYGLQTRWGLAPLLEDPAQNQRSYAHSWGFYLGFGKKF